MISLPAICVCSPPRSNSRKYGYTCLSRASRTRASSACAFSSIQLTDCSILGVPVQVARAHVRSIVLQAATMGRALCKRRAFYREGALMTRADALP